MNGRTHNIWIVRYLSYFWSSFVLLFIWWKSNVTQNPIVWRLRVRVSLAWVKCGSQHELDRPRSKALFQCLETCVPHNTILVPVFVANTFGLRHPRYFDCEFVTLTYSCQLSPHLQALTGGLCISVTTKHAAKKMCRICRTRVPIFLPVSCNHDMI